jgi:hypothetical protein
MADIITDTLGEAGINFSGESISSFITNILFWLLIILIISIVFAIIIYRIIIKKKYKYQIVIFEKINHRYIPSKRDTAMEESIGDTGDLVFYVKKHKKWLPKGNLQMGNNVFWYAIREDGEWINIGLSDIDLQMKEAKAFFLDKEMRFARAALQKNLAQRYQGMNFWQKYGGLIAYMLLILVVGIMMWLIFGKYLEITNALNGAVTSTADLIEQTKSLISIIDQLKQSGALVPA